LVLALGPCGLWAQNPARQAGYLYLSPVPGAAYVSSQTRYILVRFGRVAPSQVANLTTDFIIVTGARSGPQPGTVHVANDGKTVIFEMGKDFATNELVTVNLNPRTTPAATGTVKPFEYRFSVTAPMPDGLPEVVGASQPDVKLRNLSDNRGSWRQLNPSRRGSFGPAVVMPNGVSVPGDFPKVVITANTNPSPGYLFLETGLDGVPPYTMMLDNNGLPVWYRRGRMYDFKIQRNGMITWALSDDTGFPAFDQNFKYLKTFLATNGYSTDGHDLKVQPDGSYYMIGYRVNPVDLSHYVAGGSPEALERETVVQGFTAAGELILQWRAWDNYDVRDSKVSANFAHMNGLDIDDDGNILVSARHLSEVTKINRDSGEVMWRLGGAHSTFRFVNDPLNGTSFQHNISALGKGRYLIFDNGDFHSPPVSRAVEYQLDLTNLTATMVWEFRDTPDKYADWLGSAQRLPEGSTLIDFVLPNYPKAIEVDTNGIKRFELSLLPGANCYRVFRFPWNGMAAAPYLIVEAQVDNTTLVFNKFGDHSVASYRIYGGPSPEPTNLMAVSSSTIKQFTDLQNGHYFFRVTSVSAEGAESPFSNEESVNVNIIPPGQNIVRNGDFFVGGNSWVLTLNGSAFAGWSLEHGVSHISVTNCGTAMSDIQLRQDGLALAQGKKYVLEFDAWSSHTRHIDVQIAQSVSPFVNYSHITPPFLTANPTHYRYVFTMQQPSDFSASLLFNLGTSSEDVYLGNVALVNPPAGDVNLDDRSMPSIHGPSPETGIK